MGVGILEVLEQLRQLVVLEPRRPERAASNVGVGVPEQPGATLGEAARKPAEQAFQPGCAGIVGQSREQRRLEALESGRHHQRGGRALQAVAVAVSFPVGVSGRGERLRQIGGGLRRVRELRAGPGKERRRVRVQVDHHADRQEQRIPEGPLVHDRQQSQQRLQRFGRRDAPERLHGGLGQHRVGDQRHERPHCLRRADGAERVDRGELQPEISVHQLEERGYGLAGAELAHRFDRGLGHVGIAVVKQRQDRSAGRRVSDAGQALQGEHHQLGIGGAEHHGQVRDRVRALPLERAEPGVPARRVLAVGHQGAQHRRLHVAGGQADRAIPHRQRLVFERQEDGTVAIGSGHGRVERGQSFGWSQHPVLRPGTRPRAGAAIRTPPPGSWRRRSSARQPRDSVWTPPRSPPPPSPPSHLRGAARSRPATSGG